MKQIPPDESLNLRGRRSSDFDLDQAAREEWMGVLHKARVDFLRRLLGGSFLTDEVVAQVHLTEEFEKLLRKALVDVVQQSGNAVFESVCAAAALEADEPHVPWRRRRPLS